jgi:uncharacterized spore protein YtfJ
MDVQGAIERTRDAMTARRVYGDPYEKDGVTVIPAALVLGGGGAGGGERGVSSGCGGGFGLAARPVGAFVITNGQVSWKPAVDATRIALGGQLVAITALLVIASLLRHR